MSSNRQPPPTPTAASASAAAAGGGGGRHASGTLHSAAAAASHHHSGFGNLSSRIVVIGQEGCTGTILGTSGGDEHAALTGRIATWNEASQAFGCGEISIHERTVNCPTSKRSSSSPAARLAGNRKKRNAAAAAAAGEDQSRAKFSEGDSRMVSSARFIESQQQLESNANLQKGEGEGNNNNNNQGQQQQVSQIIHAKCYSLSHLLPAVTLEFFEVNESDVPTLATDQLFGPYVLHSSTAGVVLVIDCTMLFPTAPSTQLLIESVDSCIAHEKKRRIEAEKAEKDLLRSFASPSFSSPSKPGEGGVGGDSNAATAAAASLAQSAMNDPNSPLSPTKKNYDPNEPAELSPEIPTLTKMLETYRVRQDAAAEHYIADCSDRLMQIKQAIDAWSGESGGSAHNIPVLVSVHNTEVVAQRLEAWSLTTAWAKQADAVRQRVLSKIPKKVSESAKLGQEKLVQIPSLHSCCPPEPFTQSHLSLHRTYPQVTGTMKAIRQVISKISEHVKHPTPFYPTLTSVLDATPLALLSQLVARPQIFSQTSHLQEIVHTFKARCFFRRVFVLEPRTGLCVACDRPFPRFISGITKESVNAAALGIETSFSHVQSFIQDYLVVSDALKMTSALNYIASENDASETALVKAAFDRVEQGDILNVAEGGLSSWRGSLELSSGEGVFLYGMAPPIALVLGCIGDCAEVQRMTSLIEFNLHIVQSTAGGLFEEALKRARAAGYTH